MSDPHKKRIQDVLGTMKQLYSVGGASPMPKRAQICPNCEICGGSGWIRADVPIDHELFGKLLPCPRRENGNGFMPSGLRVREEAELSWHSVKPFELSIATNNKTRQMTADKVFLGIAAWIKEKPGTFIFAYGGYGLAKTLLLKTAVAEAIRAGRVAQYVQFSEIIDDIKAGFDSSDPRESSQAKVRRWSTLPFLAIDELDKINLTDWASERLFKLVDARYDAAMYGGSVTLIASNKRPEAISPALASRVHDGRALYLEITGRDARPAMTWDNGKTDSEEISDQERRSVWSTGE